MNAVVGPENPPSAAASEAPLSVLHVVLSLACGGLEHVVVQLCQRAKQEGRRVGVVCLERPGELADLARDAGAEVICMDKAPGLQLALRKALREQFAAWRPDVIHTHQIGALFYAGPAAKRLGLPVVHTEHGKHYANGVKLRWLARYATAHCDRYVGVARDVTEHAVERRVTRRDKATTIVNGIDLKRFADARATSTVREAIGIPADAPVIGTVGRLEEIKNYPLLLRAFARIGERHPQARLLIVGDGSQAEPLKALADELGIATRTHFAGYQPDSAPYVGAMDVFSLTSDSEGLPLSLLEGIASGAAVAASAVGGIPGVVSDGETGLLFPRRDEAAAATAFDRLLSDRGLADTCVASAASEVQRLYSRDAMADAYADLYREVAAAR